jgi:hypothetical protein
MAKKIGAQKNKSNIRVTLQRHMTGVRKQPGVPDSMHAHSVLLQDNGNQ